MIRVKSNPEIRTSSTETFDGKSHVQIPTNTMERRQAHLAGWPLPPELRSRKSPNNRLAGAAAGDEFRTLTVTARSGVFGGAGRQSSDREFCKRNRGWLI